MEHHYTNVPIKFLDRPYCLYIREIVTFRKTQLYTCIVESPKSAYGVCVSMLGDGMESNMYIYTCTAPHQMSLFLSCMICHIILYTEVTWWSMRLGLL